MNWKGYIREWSWPILDNTLAFWWRPEGKHRKRSVYRSRSEPANPQKEFQSVTAIRDCRECTIYVQCTGNVGQFTELHSAGAPLPACLVNLKHCSCNVKTTLIFGMI
jgi:hypothetical protein